MRLDSRIIQTLNAGAVRLSAQEAGRRPQAGRKPKVSLRAQLAKPTSHQCFSAMTCKLTAIIEQDQDGVFAYCPELKGCHTQGDTVEEALATLREAAELYLGTMKPSELRQLSAKLRILEICSV